MFSDLIVVVLHLVRFVLCKCFTPMKGLHPEIVPSTFEEDLPKSEFTGAAAYEYPAETAARKVCVNVLIRKLCRADW